MVLMSCRKAQIASARYLCSNCWGALEYHTKDNGSCEVTCATEGCKASGFVSKNHVEYIEKQSLSEKIKVKLNLRKHLDWISYEQKTNEQIMSELGY